MSLLLDLADALIPLGLVGVVVACASAVFAAIAFLIIDAPTAGGLAASVWLMGVILSMCGAFAHQWQMSLVSLAVLPAMLVAAAPIRLLGRPGSARKRTGGSMMTQSGSQPR